MCLVMSGQIRRILPAMVPIALVAAVVALIWGRQVSRMFGYTVSHMFDVSSGNGCRPNDTLETRLGLLRESPVQ